MSYANFKAKVWAKAIDRDLERVCVFAENTNQQYSGEIKGIGDTVRIIGVGKPTVNTHTLSSGKLTLSSAEEIADTSVSLVVDKAAYFNYGVEDIDAAQGAGKVLSVLNQESSEEVANVIDKAIADLSKEKVGVQKYSSSNTVITTSNVLEVFDGLQQKLFENDVNPSTRVTITIPPAIYKVFRQAYEKLDTDNSEMLKNGRVARYANMDIKMSNNVAVNASSHYLIQAKTDRAIALAMGESHVEPYRPESSFTDAVKGFKLFGCKIVRPKEMVVLECSLS